MILLNCGVFTYNTSAFLPKKCLLVRCRSILRTNHEKLKKPEFMQIQGLGGFLYFNEVEFVATI